MQCICPLCLKLNGSSKHIWVVSCHIDFRASNAMDIVYNGEQLPHDFWSYIGSMSPARQHGLDVILTIESQLQRISYVIEHMTDVLEESTCMGAFDSHE